MENNEPNKMVAKLYKKLKKIQQLPNEQYFEQVEPLKKELESITKVVGAIEVMSKANILKLCAMHSKLRPMQLHSFLIYVSKANDDFNYK